MAELADALDLGSSGATHKSSILFTRTMNLLYQFPYCGGGVAHAVGKSPFVIIPCRYMHQISVDNLRLGRVKYRTVRVMGKVN